MGMVGVELALEAVKHVVGIEVAAVVELDALAQVEAPAVGLHHFPTLCQGRFNGQGLGGGEFGPDGGVAGGHQSRGVVVVDQLLAALPNLRL